MHQNIVTGKQLDRRLLLQREILQRKNNKLCIKVHDKKRHRQFRIYRKSIMFSRTRSRIHKTNREKAYRDWEKTQKKITTQDKEHIALPKYYKYKLFTEDQREQLWIYRENSGEKFVGNTLLK